MDVRYDMYCLADPVFYDAPALAREDPDWERATPERWERFELRDWLVYQPENLRLAPQGWKIHASACLDNAEEILAAVWDYCIPRRIPFKFLRSKQVLFIRNLKSADRQSSGKFVTIYPADDAQLEIVLTELDAILGGRPGPYILSDLRWGKGPLYVRYGGFAERYCVGPSGELEPAVEDDEGRLVPDRRGTSFEVPSWVAFPPFLAPHLAERTSAKVDDLPYRIDSALHFSNSGGVYRGVDRATGADVVLKEARPYAGLSEDRADAVTRLHRERMMLTRLAGLDVVPALRDCFTLGDHHFLVVDFVAASSLNALVAGRYPLTAAETDSRVAADYTAWALEIARRVERAVEVVHSRGVLIGDLHPSNVLVPSDGEVVLIDWEVAALAIDGPRPSMGAPGFSAPRSLAGFDVDRYALACLRLYLFLPLTRLIALDSGKAEQLAAEIAELFPVPAEFLSEAVAVIEAAQPRTGTVASHDRPRLDPDPSGWRQARDSMVRAIQASATLSREDRLFPGDVQQFAAGGGLALAHGAAGVLYALDAVGAGRYPEYEEWLVDRAMRPPAGTPMGFYNGMHGVAHVLDRLERPSEALKVLDLCVDRLAGAWEQLGLDLFGGLAGVALNLSYFAAATGEPALWDLTWRSADLVADRLGRDDHARAGLLHGSSGPALLFLRLFERTHDRSLLDLAATAIRQDLRRCVLLEDGSLHVNEGWRTMPYLAAGSVGIGIMMREYLAHREDEEFARAVATIRGAAAAQFYVASGLFAGRAGVVLALGHEFAPGAAAHDPVVAAHVRRLAWHALTHQGHLAFPGDGLLRLSMDLAGGTAGVLLALGAALHDGAVHLPFLPARPRTGK